jgi:hypothetical protein
MAAEPDKPIACTLGGTDYRERRAWIARLNRDGLLRHRREQLVLELHYARDVQDRVRELMRKEAECCAFMEFEFSEAATDVRVTITAPQHARDVANDLFDIFLSTAEDADLV